MRHCIIVNGSVGGDENAADDGAYDLFEVMGTPDEIGKAIADSLKEVDLWSGRCPSRIEAGLDVYVNLTIRVSAAVGPSEVQ